MTKAELADKVYEWLKSEEKTMTTSIQGITNDRTMMFIKIPYGKKSMSEVCTVIYGEITDMDDWCGTRNFSRAGFWLPEKEVLLEDNVYGYHFHEVNPHFVDEGNLIEQFKKTSKREIFDYYHRKYPTIESFGVGIDNSDTVKAIRAKIMDLDWMKGTAPGDVWGYFKEMAHIGWGMCNITDAMCIRYLSGEETILRDLFTTPFMDENNADMKVKIEDVKASLAMAYEYNELQKAFKPSARAIATKKIVDAIHAYLDANKNRKVQNVRVTGTFDRIGEGSFSIGIKEMNCYEAVYDGISRYWRKNADSGIGYEELLPENVVKISYGKKVIYTKGI